MGKTEESKLRLVVESKKAVDGAKKATDALKKTTKAGDKTKKSFDGIKTGAGQLSGALKGLGLSFGAMKIASVIQQTIDLGDKYQKMAIRLGTTADELSRFSYVSELAGATLEEVETSVRYLNRSLDESKRGAGRASTAFERLGVTAEQLENAPLVEQMEILAVAFNNIETESAKTAIAFDLFGRSGTKMLNIFEGGAESIRALATESDNLGLTITQLEADQMADLNDSLTTLKKVAQAGTRAFVMELAPALETTAESMATGAEGADGLTFAMQKLGWASKKSIQLVDFAGSTLAFFGTLAVTEFGKMGQTVDAIKGDFIDSGNALFYGIQRTNGELDKTESTEKTLAETLAEQREEREKLRKQRERDRELSQQQADAERERLDILAEQQRLIEKQNRDRANAYQQDRGAFESLVFNLDPVQAYMRDINEVTKALKWGVENAQITLEESDALLNAWAEQNAGRLVETKDVVANVGDEISDQNKLIIESSMDMATALSDSFAEMFIDGKTDWRDFATYAVQMIGRVITELVTMRALAGATNAVSTVTTPKTSIVGGSLTAYADGGVVDNQTFFGTPSGLGVAGESGTEAILPLKRGNDGKLGVSMDGNASNSVSAPVTVVVEGDASERTVAMLRAQSAGLSKQIKNEILNEINNGGRWSRAVGRRA